MKWYKSNGSSIRDASGRWRIERAESFGDIIYKVRDMTEPHWVIENILLCPDEAKAYAEMLAKKADPSLKDEPKATASDKPKVNLKALLS